MEAADLQLLDSLSRILGDVRSQLQTPANYHLVIVPDAGNVSVLRFDSLESLVASLRELSRDGVQCVPFVGHTLHLTRPVRNLSGAVEQFLVTDGGSYPLFEPTGTATEDTWRLGDSLPDLGPPSDVVELTDASTDLTDGEDADG